MSTLGGRTAGRPSRRTKVVWLEFRGIMYEIGDNGVPKRQETEPSPPEPMPSLWTYELSSDTEYLTWATVGGELPADPGSWGSYENPTY